ncbi:hypothetical protein [Streptosporangium sp. 'caverna']|uniref:hypothetical protein n=1 Tax=Streptosporangium sp. 'caverna' TaxID=2202249 RepID=UPI0013A6ABFF|nr:hypothetical protein [Streptosporangium sp. 'caverna']
MTRRKIAAALLAAGTILGTTVAVAPPANAMACEQQIGLTSWSGNVITGYGSLTGCPSASTAGLWIQRWSGWRWEEVAGPVTAHQGYDTFIRFNCAGWGTQTWRTLINGVTVGGVLKVKGSNEIRFHCG